MTRLPSTIEITSDVVYRIDKDCWLSSGYENRDKRLIGIKQADAYRMHETLLHEILHAAEAELMAQGMLIAKSPERYIEEMGVLVFGALMKAGLYNLREHPDWYQETLDFDEQEEPNP